MKKTIIAIALSLLGLSAVAQRDDFSIENAGLSADMPLIVGFGPKVGVSVGTMSGTVDGSKPTPVISTIMGGTIEFRLAHRFTASIDVLYNGKGFINNNLNYRESAMSIITPVVINYYLTPRFTVKAGVEPSITMSVRKMVQGESHVMVTDQWKRLSYGATIGIGYITMKGVEYELRYAHGLSTARLIDNNKNRTLYLGLSYKF